MTGMKRPANMSQIRSIYERWERLEKERRDLSDDLKELFSEAKSNGFNSKALRSAFAEKYRLENEEEGKREQRQMDEADADLYLAALGAPSHACEAIQSYAEAKGRDAGVFISTRISDETNEILHTVRAPGDPNIVVGRELADTQEQPETPATQTPARPPLAADDEAAQANPSSSAPIPSAADSLPGAVKAPEAGFSSPASGAILSEADVPAFLRKSAADYRPHCLHPDACGSSNPLGHCYTCKRAMEAAEMENA